MGGDVIETLAQTAEIHEEILADHAHDLPDGVTGLELALLGETAQQGDVDGGIEAVDHGSLDPEPVSGGEGTARIEPLGRLEPFAESPRILVEPEVLEHERERADGLVLGGKLVMVEIAAIGLVLAADIDDKDAGIIEIGRLGITTPHGQSVPRNEEATSEEVVFVGAPGMARSV